LPSRLWEGDALVRYAGKPVDSAPDLPFLAARAAGTGIELEIRRDGALQKLTVRGGPLGQSPKTESLPNRFLDSIQPHRR